MPDHPTDRAIAEAEIENPPADRSNKHNAEALRAHLEHFEALGMMEKAASAPRIIRLAVAVIQMQAGEIDDLKARVARLEENRGE